MRQKERGITIVPVIIAAGMLSIASIAGTRLLVNQGLNNQSLQVVSVNQSRIVFQKQILSRDPLDVIRHSAGFLGAAGGTIHCPELRDCIENGACPLDPTPCAFHLGRTQLTGSASNSLLASVTGKDCSNINNPSKDCPLEIKGFFRQKGQNLEMWSTVAHTGPLLPNNLRLKGYDGLNTQDIVSVSLNRFKFECPESFRLVSFDETGKPICQSMLEGFESMRSGSTIIIPSEHQSLLEEYESKGGTVSDFYDEIRKKYMDTLGVETRICPNATVMIGLTRDARPICREFPTFWRFNSIRVTTIPESDEAAYDDRHDISVAMAEIAANEDQELCGDNIAQTICEKKDQFCWAPWSESYTFPLINERSTLSPYKDDHFGHVPCLEGGGSLTAPGMSVKFFATCPSRTETGFEEFSAEERGEHLFYPVCRGKRILIKPVRVMNWRIYRCVHPLDAVEN